MQRHLEQYKKKILIKPLEACTTVQEYMITSMFQAMELTLFISAAETHIMWAGSSSLSKSLQILTSIQ